MEIEIKILKPGDEGALANVLPDVFDNPVSKNLSSEFLADPRHHLAVAVDGNMVVGFASAVHYVHPDKSPELWINEVGVASTYRNRGLAKQILGALLEVGRQLGCNEAWVLTDRPNTAAMRLYESLGGKGTDHVMFTFHL
jgi:aminoglycoside 6'-N-acetyltransferase I